MKKKMIIAGIVNIVTALVSVLCLALIFLDYQVFKWTSVETDGWDGLGMGLLLVVSILYEYPTTLLAVIFQGVNGGLMLAYGKRGKGVHKALRVIAWIFAVISFVVHAFFVFSHFENALIFWGVLTVIAGLCSIAAPIMATIAHKE